MKKLEIVGFKRANLGSKGAKDLRAEALAPCVLYGGKEQVHFSVPMILFRELLYSADVYEVELNVEGDKYRAVLQDAQFHPVNESILHVDFQEIKDDKTVDIGIPVKVVGNSVGVRAGGKLIVKAKKLRVRALPSVLPDFIEINIELLEIGKSIKVAELAAIEGIVFLDSPNNPIVSIKTTRAVQEAAKAEEKDGKKKK
jgi:large subunit ribosomal protein L25